MGKWTPLHTAAQSGEVDKVWKLLEGGKYDVNCVDGQGWTPLHEAAYRGHLGVVRLLISEFKAEVNASTNSGSTPLHWAAEGGHLDVVRVLISEFKADVNVHNNIGVTPLHWAASRGHLDVVRVLISEFKADVNVHNNIGVTPLHWAASRCHLAVVRVLISEFKADVNVQSNSGITPLHEAAAKGYLGVVRVLISEFKADVSALAKESSKLFDMAVNNHMDREEMAVFLMNEFHCDTKGGTPYIHTACERGWVSLIRALVQKHGTKILNARDKEGNTPPHLAANAGREDYVQFLIGIGCDVNVTGHLGRSLLHSACVSNNGSLVRLVSQHISPWVVDDNGDTPLHTCARLGKISSVRAMLELDPPVMIRNNLGKTPRDLEKDELSQYKFIGAYMKENKAKIYSQYEVVQRHAKKKYSRPEPIARAFVVGNPGAGKSSLVEALKREGFVDSFKRVSESSVPPHTAGIVPSIHTSKHYGRVLFYDFAGNAEYYSSHAAILENLASSRKGDNVFILVIDMREEMAEIKKIFHYWLSFVQHQQFHGQKPPLIVVGSHLDLLTEDVAKARGKELQMFYNSINSTTVKMSALFKLDCCKPRSKQIAEIQNLMSKLTNDSPRFKLSLQASTLLGLLEKDFSNVPACSTQALLSHIEDTGILLLAKKQSLRPILLELHDLGLLFLIGSSNRELKCSSKHV